MESGWVISYFVLLGFFFSPGTYQAWAEFTESKSQPQNGGRHRLAHSDLISGLRSRESYRERSPPTSARERMLHVKTVDDFLSLLTKNGHPVTSEDIYSKYPSWSGQKMVVGGGVLAIMDHCSPRPATVSLELPAGEQADVYYPTCTRVDRCDGGALSPSPRHFACVPEQTETLKLKVIKAQLPYPGASSFSFSGFQTVLVERHVKCSLQCQLKPEMCGPRKRLVPSTCHCACANDERCLGNTVWDAETCRCACARKVDCCCGRVFNPESCQCEMSGNRPISILEDGAGSLIDQEQEKTSTTTTTTTTTTTLSPLERCASVRCPPSFTVHLGSDGHCVCWPPPKRRYYYRRRHSRNYHRAG